MTGLEKIQEGRGIKSIVCIKGGAEINGEIIDWYEITYFTKMGNLGLERGTKEMIEDILNFNESLPIHKKKKVQIR